METSSVYEQTKVWMIHRNRENFLDKVTLPVIPILGKVAHTRGTTVVF